MFAKKSSNHDELSGNSSAKLEIRQDRFSSDGKLKLQTNLGVFTIKNYSLFGLAGVGEIELALGQTISETQLFFFGDQIGEFSLVIRRKEQQGNGWEYGFETITDVIPVEQIHNMMEIKSSLSLINEKAEKTSVLPTEFRCHVQELNSKLRSFEQIAKSFESKIYSNKGERETALDLVVSILGSEIFQELRQTNRKLQQIIEHQSENILKGALQYFRDSLGEYLYQSPFTRRSFEKPRGYAGDFEMMNQIYRNDNFAQSLFGSCMERAVHLHEEPTAVRNRSTYLADKIISLVASSDGQETINILSVACGPAEEVKLAVNCLTQGQLDRITFWLLDQDEDALKFAQKNIKSMSFEKRKKVRVNLINKGIKELILEGTKDQSFDLIYSAGLFDYFSDPVAIRAGKVLSRAVVDGGKLIIGNFNIVSPNWFGMLSLFDWHLILRGESDLSRIFNFDGYNLSIEAEPENVNLFCVIKRE
jgi:extracellular factor (EF) 3-hydroxypalmitic acid methyl ester biosynthesis protein